MREEKYTWMAGELDRICGVLKRNMERYGTDFPSACATGGKYRIKKNDDWTNGFWTGMLWMAYLHTGDEVFKTLALKNTDSFRQRLDDHFVLDHHDIGFLYSPSVVAAYRVTGDEGQRDLAVRAADVLAARFQEKGGFIQAWGRSGDPKEYRLIIDSLLNLPLLYTAAEITGEQRYREIAGRHYENVIRYIIREDGSTYHTYYFDSETGAPSRGATHQGYSDNSCWARGQAWAIYGMPLHVRVSGRAFTPEEQERHDRVVRYFLEHLPANGMPYWDLVFKDGDGQPWDSSALAVAACGMLEMAKYMEEDDRKYYTGIAKKLMKSVVDHYAVKDPAISNGQVLHSTYSNHSPYNTCNHYGVDECNIWGDYFYMEALMRLHKDWQVYWERRRT